MDKFILDHINRLHQEGLSEEAVKSLNVLESEIGVLSAELELAKEELSQNRYFTLTETAKIMNISRKRLDEIIRNSEIPVIKYTSKALLIDWIDIRKFVESKKVYYNQLKGGELAKE